MGAFAPRIPPRLLREIERGAIPGVSYAELCRRVGEAAERLGVPRPSYEQVRALARDAIERRDEPGTSEVLVDIAFRARAPEELLDHVSGVGVRPLPGSRK